MNKSELVAAVAEAAGTSKKDTEAVINSFVEVVEKTVAKKDSVALVGFGTFEAAKRAAREGRNPQTGETIKIKATTVPKFKAGKAFKERVAKGK